MPKSNRRLAAIMFTDMVGFTALGQRNESLSLAVLEEQRRLVRPVVARHGGREIKTVGDAFLVEFPSALDAARCAYDLQRGAREYNFSVPEEKSIHLRIGIHLGDVVEEEGDISGDAVNVASRVEPLAENGGVCLTRQVFDQVTNKFDLPLESIGMRELKNVRAPIELYKMTLPWEASLEAGPLLDRRRVAVLPFANISPDPADEYLADGMTEELITSLSGVRGLTVIGRTSVMQYKKAPKPIADIGKELRAGALVEGSVRKAANRLRITVQLVDSQSEGHIWAQNYDRQMEDIFAIESEIAEKVSRELEVRLLDSEKRKVESKPTESTEAYTLYLKGRYYWNERSGESLRTAIGYLSKAVQTDPKFAVGYSALAACYQVQGYNRQADFLPSYEKAIEYSRKALDLDPEIAEAHTVLGAATYASKFDIEKASSEMRRALDLNPGYPMGHQWYAQILWFQRRLDEAEAELKKALEIDPLSLIINVNLGDAYRLQGRMEDAIRQYSKVVQLEPTFYPSHSGLTQAYTLYGQFEKAFQEAEEVVRLTQDLSWEKVWKAWINAYMEKAAEARSLLAEAEAAYVPGKSSPSPYDIAVVRFKLGDNDQGFGWLERAYETRDSGLSTLLLDDEMKKVRSDPRFVDMAGRIGLGEALRTLLTGA